MNRRNVLLGLGTAAAGSGIVFGSGAFTQVQASRDVTIGIEQDSDALLALQSNSNITSVDNDDSTGELVINTDKLSTDDDGFNVGSTVQIGETETTLPDPSTAQVVDELENGNTGAAFSLTNNFNTIDADTDGNNLDIGISLNNLTDPDSNLVFIGTEYNGSSVEQTKVSSTGSGNTRAVFSDVKPGNKIYFAIQVETTSSADPSNFNGSVVFDTGPNLADKGPISPSATAESVVNASQDETYNSIYKAVNEAATGDLIQVTSGTYNPEASNVSGDVLLLDTVGITLEGPNAGIRGDGTRGSEAVINGPVMIGADNITIDGFKINDSDSAGTIAPETLPGPGAVQLAAGSGYGETADGATLRNNVIEAGVDGDDNDEDYGLYTTDIVDVVISRNKFTEDTPAASLYNTGTSLVIEFSNNVDETTNANSLAGQAIPQDTVIDTT